MNTPTPEQIDAALFRSENGQKGHILALEDNKILAAALTASREDSRRLDMIENKTKQGGWRLTEIPGDYHAVQLKSGHRNGSDTLRKALSLEPSLNT